MFLIVKHIVLVSIQNLTTNLVILLNTTSVTMEVMFLISITPCNVPPFFTHDGSRIGAMECRRQWWMEQEFSVGLPRNSLTTLYSIIEVVSYLLGVTHTASPALIISQDRDNTPQTLFPWSYIPH
jgi:hypothetical protein